MATKVMTDVVVDREVHSARTRVLDAAAQLIFDKGFFATSMRDIAAAVGIKAGSLYHHFNSKEEIFIAILERGIDVMVSAFDQVCAQEAEGGFANAEALVQAHVRAHLASLFEFGPYTAAHVTTFHNAPTAVHEIVVERRDAYEAMWAGLIERLDQQGSLQVDDPTIARLVLLGGMNTTVEWFDPGGTMSLDGLAEWIAKQFLNGVGAP